MAQVSYKVTGLKETQAGLVGFDADIAPTASKKIEPALQAARKRITTYPPPVGRYARTGTYGEGWEILATSNRAKAAGFTLIGSARQTGEDYASLVGGDELGRGQAAAHEGRWVIAREAVDEEVDKLPPEIEAGLILAAKRRGL